jgi:anti-sigma factor RsiW
MDCRQAQEEILEMFDGACAPEVHEHLASCRACAEFLARQSALDRELAGMLEPPALSPVFRARLRQRIRQEPARLWPEALPDIVHLASCGAATLLCAALLPFAAGPVLAVGTVVTAGSYVLVLAARIWLDA